MLSRPVLTGLPDHFEQQVLLPPIFHLLDEETEARSRKVTGSR